MSERFGPKMVLLSGMVATATCTLFTPTVVTFGGATGMIAIRVLIGAMQGAVWAPISSILSAWIPKKERSTLISFAYCGMPVNKIVVSFC